MVYSPQILAKYRQQLINLQSTPYMDYPQHIHLETLALCPAACHFCPYPTLTRKGHKMSDHLLDKILNDLRDIPTNLPFQLSPFKVNEPFLDTRLIPLLKKINQDLPQALLSLTSNAVPITPEKLLALADIRNLAYLWISLNEYEAEPYTRVMQLPWERTLERLHMIHQQAEKGRLPFDLILSRVGDGTERDSGFGHWVLKTFPLFKPTVFQRGNWLAQVDLEQIHAVPDLGCVRWFDLSITATGTVAHCCMDGEAAWPIGDLTTQHVLEVYNQPEYKRLRQSTLSRLSAEPCKNCTFL